MLCSPLPVGLKFDVTTARCRVLPQVLRECCLEYFTFFTLTVTTRATTSPIDLNSCMLPMCTGLMVTPIIYPPLPSEEGKEGMKLNLWRSVLRGFLAGRKAGEGAA